MVSGGLAHARVLALYVRVADGVEIRLYESYFQGDTLVRINPDSHGITNGVLIHSPTDGFLFDLTLGDFEYLLIRYFPVGAAQAMQVAITTSEDQRGKIRATVDRTPMPGVTR